MGDQLPEDTVTSFQAPSNLAQIQLRKTKWSTEKVDNIEILIYIQKLNVKIDYYITNVMS